MSNAEGPVGAELGELLASGRDADVYALGGDRVLRRYRRGGDVAGEAALMRQVWRSGFPVPLVYAAVGADLVLERLPGPTMLAALLRGELAPETAGKLLAALHQRLHALPAPSGRPGVRIIHLDLHPDNVIMARNGPVVIDWRNATEGLPDLDLAMTALILAEAAEGSFGQSEADPVALAAAARSGLVSFLSHAGGDPGGQLESAVASRSSDPALSPAERGRVVAAAALVRAIVAERSLPQGGSVRWSVEGRPGAARTGALVSGGNQVVRAAGGVVWRAGATGVEIVLVYRSRYQDWSLPKGKLDPGETWEQAAVREVGEETGQAVELGEPLGQVEYPDRENGGRPPRRKVVRYWVMRALGGAFTPDLEVDEVRWLPVADALGVLTHQHDRDLVQTFADRTASGTTG